MAVKHIVSFSGGLGSFSTAADVIGRYGTEDTVLVFCDTMIEHPDLYRFLYEAADKLGAQLVYLADGRDPWQVFHDRKYQGNTRLAHCTTELKGKVFKNWLLSNYKPEECVLYLGFSVGEEHRLKTAENNWYPYRVKSPLTEPPYTSKSEVLNLLDELDIKMPELYTKGFLHNNCGGFCVKAGTKQFKKLLKEYPHVYIHHEAKQEKLKSELKTFRPFLRMFKDKKTYYVTLKEFREYVESGGEVDPFEAPGCGCFTDFSLQSDIPVVEV